jgi:hypothetical protein
LIEILNEKDIDFIQKIIESNIENANIKQLENIINIYEEKQPNKIEVLKKLDTILNAISESQEYKTELENKFIELYDKLQNINEKEEFENKAFNIIKELYKKNKKNAIEIMNIFNNRNFNIYEIIIKNNNESIKTKRKVAILYAKSIGITEETSFNDVREKLKSKVSKEDYFKELFENIDDFRNLFKNPDIASAEGY